MHDISTPAQKQKTGSSALKFVVLIGVVSLFADMTYEGARSITGPYLAVLGATGTAVGIIAGFGEFAGYALRLASGFLADKTKRYWTLTIVGYAVNLLAVPLLAVAGRWETAGLLMVMERVGKGVRTPARDAMLSHAASGIGAGWAFGLHEALDQIGATVGPLIVAAVLIFKGSYPFSFAVLLVPAVLALSTLAAACLLYPRPRDLEPLSSSLATKGFSGLFWIYLAAAACVAAGYADFSLVAYHFEKAGSVPDKWIPIFYALAMGFDGLAAVVCGFWFDRKGIAVLIIGALVSAFFAPLVFYGNFYLALAGVVLWGIGMGAQESILRAVIAGMVEARRRGTAYGVFNAGFGLSWFLGSMVMGMLYDFSLLSLVVFSIGAQLAAIPLLLVIKGKVTQPRG
ncbi:MAG TPA: MFS transporter [Burkholderiales bacterium]|nr:MFS transporter [Burkholderiales bacterium]